MAGIELSANTGGDQSCNLQGGVQGTQLQGGVREDRVAWQNWCEEYRRLLKQIVFDSLAREFLGQNMLYRANVQVGFYNPKLNSAQLLRHQIAANRQSATVFEPPGMIVVISKPVFNWSTRQSQSDDQFRYARFKTRFNQLTSELANRIPAFPQPSFVPYFPKPLTISLNGSSNAEIQYGECEQFLDVVESDLSTRRK
jgi:hypothetical protein